MRKMGRPRKKKELNLKRIQLRVPENVVQEVDSIIDDMPLPTSRHKWILEAIVEKLDKTRVPGLNGN